MQWQAGKDRIEKRLDDGAICVYSVNLKNEWTRKWNVLKAHSYLLHSTICSVKSAVYSFEQSQKVFCSRYVKGKNNRRTDKDRHLLLSSLMAYFRLYFRKYFWADSCGEIQYFLLQKKARRGHFPPLRSSVKRTC